MSNKDIISEGQHIQQQHKVTQEQIKIQPSVVQKKKKAFNDLFGIPTDDKPYVSRPFNQQSNKSIVKPVQERPVNPLIAPPKKFENLFGFPGQASRQPVAAQNKAHQVNLFFSNLLNNPTNTRLVGNINNLSFQDDDEVKQKEQFTTQSDNRMEFSLKSQYSEIKLSKDITLPCICSIKGINGVRTHVDLICVIDISGSMRGQKIALVRDALKYVVQMLNQKDRLSIVIYDNVGTRLCPLQFANKDNKTKFSQIINGINANGGNIMLNGLEVAIKILRERRTKNEVTSVFLLSDGQEPVGTELKFKSLLQKQQNEKIGSFSLHSFGFGADHDEKLMTNMCSIKDGNFYFINKLSSLDEAFCNALGGILTQAASNLEITVSCLQGDIEGIKIAKVHGDKWKNIDQKTYRIQLNQIMSEVSKDFAFQIFIPQNKSQIRQNISIIKAFYSANDRFGNKIQGQATLKINLLEHNCQKEVQTNSEVIENYLRINAAQKIEESIALADQGKYEQSKMKIQELIQTTKGCSRVKYQNKKGIIEDLEVARQKCSRDLFGREGKKELVNLWHANTNKTSFQYSNQYQKQMLFALKDCKQKKH